MFFVYNTTFSAIKEPTLCRLKLISVKKPVIFRTSYLVCDLDTDSTVPAKIHALFEHGGGNRLLELLCLSNAAAEELTDLLISDRVVLVVDANGGFYA